MIFLSIMAVVCYICLWIVAVYKICSWVYNRYTFDAAWLAGLFCLGTFVASTIQILTWMVK